MGATPFWGICDHGTFCQHRKRKGSGFELEVVKVPQAMSLAKPATDPDSGIFTASMA